MTATAQLTAKVDTYLRSIDLADIELAATVWDTTSQVSFIHPRGYERGWEEIATRGTVRLTVDPTLAFVSCRSG